MKNLENFKSSKLDRKQLSKVVGGGYWYVITRSHGTTFVHRFESIGDAAAYANATGGEAGYHSTHGGQSA